MVYSLSDIFIPILGLGLIIFLTPIIIAYKVLADNRWSHIFFTEILLYYFAYLTGPLSPLAHTVPAMNTPEYWFYIYFSKMTQTNILVAYSVVGCAFIWSIMSMKKRWYESGMLLYYELVVYFEFFILMPLIARLVWDKPLALLFRNNTHEDMRREERIIRCTRV